MTRLETITKENLSNKSNTELKNKSDYLNSRFVEIQNFLEQFDAETIKQSKEIADGYLK